MDYETAFENYEYDSVTGKLTNKKSGRGRGKIGEEAGSKDEGGYRQLQFGGKKYKAHRIAYLLMTGVWPENEIDHINGDRADNRWENLRAVTRSENMKNAAIRSDNTSGSVGVYWHKLRGKWQVKIRSFGRCLHLGLFLKKEEAIAARKAAEIAHGYHPGHGKVLSNGDS